MRCVHQQRQLLVGKLRWFFGEAWQEAETEVAALENSRFVGVMSSFDARVPRKSLEFTEARSGLGFCGRRCCLASMARARPGTFHQALGFAVLPLCLAMSR